MPTESILKPEKIQDLMQFDTGPDRSLLQNLLETIACPEDLAASPFQVHNFILNRREFCTDWAQMKQAKTEIFHRLCDLNEMAYDYAKKRLELRRLQRRAELLDQAVEDTVMREIERDAIALEVQREHFQVAMIRIQAHARFLEAAEFFTVYQKFRALESLPAPEIAELEERQWRIKSRYFPELRDRYNMTPDGLRPLPHQLEKSKTAAAFRIGKK